MRILTVDTSSQAGGIAILEDSRVVLNVFERSGEEYSSRLFRQLDLLLKETCLKLSDFDLFAVAAGPGSFTGLRIGMTAVKAWAEVFGKPISPVSGLKALAAQAIRKTEYIAAFMDARRGQIFGGLFRHRDGKLIEIGDEVVMRPDEFLGEISVRLQSQPGSKQLQNLIGFVSPTLDLIPVGSSGSELHNAPSEKVSEDLAPWIGRLAFEQAQRGETATALALDANYIRRSDAEQYWKES
ncbi:MAG TPA: tRNA (adenosine(37)-N6)-threonylcarbamoyltransferase complex dimerization subunit type 1 TsaB [Candidatus Acidoferrales bacterium]|nr:tRNA (adenosine(37)-N6)-threonylcarbamoyltransferase complex dimerization subunit type 1 TsaB [Candidatus Acidoferrales bacterium]